eukprot:6086615-Prymnesium_polylepis.1
MIFWHELSPPEHGFALTTHSPRPASNMPVTCRMLPEAVHYARIQFPARGPREASALLHELGGGFDAAGAVDDKCARPKCSLFPHASTHPVRCKLRRRHCLHSRSHRLPTLHEAGEECIHLLVLRLARRDRIERVGEYSLLRSPELM